MMDTVHVTNFVSNHDAKQKSTVFIDASSLCWVAGRSYMSETHQIAISSLRANVVSKNTRELQCDARTTIKSMPRKNYLVTNTAISK